MIVKTNCLILFFALLNFSVKAQKQVTSQSLHWLRYYNILTINPKWALHNEVENRRFFDGNQQHHFIAHTRLYYKILPRTDIAAGITYSLQSPQFIASTSTLVVPEIRPNQEINISNILTQKLTLQHRLRIDERFIRKNNGQQLLDGYDFNLRFRYRIQLNYRLGTDSAKNKTSIKLSNELMLNGGKNIVYNQFDQNRIYACCEQEINKQFSLELGYLHLYQQRAAQYQFFDRKILRLTVYHKL
ncbi:MAG: DUF2490 domain-containing protein [Sphingobacteriales bacterium]|nr:MAG: DUF2490 domain-containing protein [Sphingobacteriales bacterium]TAF79338.1 MAG: DUF2490 domain-containing protein [Sphingobacteriales bacterium]